MASDPYPKYDPSQYAPPPQPRQSYSGFNDYAVQNQNRGGQGLRRQPRYYSDEEDDDDYSDFSDDDRRDRRSKSHARPRSVGRSRSRRRRSDSIPRSRSVSRGPNGSSERYTVAKALKCAAMAAAVETVRCRKEPGEWSGQKGKRVAIAAGSAMVVGSLRNGRLKKEGKLPLAEAAFSGIYAVDFLKRVLRHTEFGEGEEKEKEYNEEDRRDSDRRGRDANEDYHRERSRSKSKRRSSMG